MIPLRKEHINNFKTKLSLKSEQTQETYFLIVDKFLRYVKNDLTTNNTIKFFTTISKNSIHTTFYAIRFFYNSAGIPFDLRIGDIATKGTIQRIRESFNPDEVNAFIKASKLYGGIIDIGYATISTIYGARRKEIYNIEPKDIAEDISTLKIHTLKGGQDRVHLIPEEIKEVIKDFRYGLTRIKKKPVVTTLNMMFDNLCYKGGIELRPRIGFHCLHEETTILTKNGYKNIKDITVDNQVYDKDGKLTHVINTFKNYYKGEIYNIKASGLLEIKVTPNHPILVAKFKYIYHKDLKNQNKNPYRKKLINIEWKLPNEIDYDDYLIIPKLSENNKNDKEEYYFNIDKHIRKYGRGGKTKHFLIGINETDRKILEIIKELKFKIFTRKNIEKILPINKYYISKILRTFAKQDFINIIFKKNGFKTIYSKNENIIIPVEKFPLNKYTAYLFGRWVADGSSSRGGAQIAFNINEIEEAESICKIIESQLLFKARLYPYYNLKAKIKGKEIIGNSLVLSFGGRILNRFFKDKFGHNAKFKKIPFEIMTCNNKEIIKNFILGYIAGDGYTRKLLRKDKQSNNYSTEISSISKGLLLQLQLLLSRLNISSTIRNSKSDKSRFHININEQNYAKLFNENIKIKEQNITLEDSDNFYYKINKIIIMPFEGYVYNLETESHTYLAQNIITHNSIRRSLISELMMTDINPTVIRDFLRWKTRESDIIMNYTIFNYERVDKMVFEKHPFLEYWR